MTVTGEAGHHIKLLKPGVASGKADHTTEPPKLETFQKGMVQSVVPLRTLTKERGHLRTERGHLTREKGRLTMETGHLNEIRRLDSYPSREQSRGDSHYGRERLRQTSPTGSPHRAGLRERARRSTRHSSNVQPGVGKKFTDFENGKRVHNESDRNIGGRNATQYERIDSTEDWDQKSFCGEKNTKRQDFLPKNVHGDDFLAAEESFTANQPTGCDAIGSFPDAATRVSSQGRTNGYNRVPKRVQEPFKKFANYGQWKTVSGG
ncbi:hypothetical protein BaRGS_00036413 [Batillaria attramentaria]|uniref:Uncharacterized protein n=1 Tax=Batillaria attramentaria TaxID=370345 RepID=A0ABD0JBY7_9CAEN